MSVFGDEERKEMLRLIKKYTKKLKSSKEESTKFLMDLGMLTKGGKLKKEYKAR